MKSLSVIDVRICSTVLEQAGLRHVLQTIIFQCLKVLQLFFKHVYNII